MALFNWDESLSVKIQSIDLQHQDLIAMVNEFYQSIGQGVQKEKLLEIIERMKVYTINHFLLEERYMKRTGFPGYENHKKEHDAFVVTVNDYEERYKNGKLLMSVEITNFLKSWITNHIMNVDQLYSNFMIQKGII